MESGFRPRLRRSVILLAIPLLLASPMIGGVLAQPIPPTQSPSIHPASTPGRPRATSQGYSYPTHLVPNSSKPVNSTLGYFDGEWYNSTLHITPGKPLNASERHAFVARTMARDELILHRNYKHYVPVKFLSRQSYKQERGLNNTNSSTAPSKGSSNATPPTNSTYSQWNNVIWRATFIVGEHQNVQAVMNRFYGGHVGGYYAPHPNNVTLVSPNGTVAGLAPSTLAHELTHAMQNQYYNISQEKYQGRTQDSQLAAEGLLEGQANYVKAVYHHECQSGQWSCLSQQASSTRSQSSASSSASGSTQGSQQSASHPHQTQTNYGVEWVLYFPYAMGPHYISTLVNQHGWQAVYHRFQTPPKTSATIIADHPVPPATINVSLPTGSHWQRYQGVGVNGTDRPGEATIYSMLWWQTYHRHARLIPPRSIINKHGGPFDHYDYSSPPSAGWTGGKIVPFHSQANASRRGFVWATTWRTHTNATQFRTAYKLILQAHNATKTGPSTWTVPASDAYAGTYRLTTNGTTDTIVSAPSPQALTELSPSVTVHAAQTPTNTTPSPTTSQTATSTTTATHTNASSPPTSSSSPGFGVAVALAAFALVAGLVALSRRS